MWRQRHCRNTLLANLALELVPLKKVGDGNQESTLLIKGIAALPLARLEEGTQLCCPSHGGIVPVQVMVWPVPGEADPLAVLEARLEQRMDWQRGLTNGEAKIDEDPFRLLPVDLPSPGKR